MNRSMGGGAVMWILTTTRKVRGQRETRIRVECSASQREKWSFRRALISHGRIGRQREKRTEGSSSGTGECRRWRKGTVSDATTGRGWLEDRGGLAEG